MAFYDDLLKATEQERNALMSLPLIQQGGAGNISLQTYVAFLTQAYHHVKHTTPLLMACGGRLSGQYEWLRTAIGEYIEEEMGHQEWVLNDIETSGGNKEAVRHSADANTSPSQATELMVAYAYDMIYRVNPVSYLLSHGSLDISHVTFYESLMNQITDEKDQALVIHAAKMFYKLYGDVFRDIAARTM
jgi:thiaminase